MNPSPSASPANVSPSLVFFGSVVLVAHLLAIGVMALSAPSGPWASPFGETTAAPPQFAQALSEIALPYYCAPLRMTSSYHFLSNRPGLPGVFFEVNLKDADGKPMATLTFPDEQVNPWVRHREAILARALADDQPVPPPQGEAVAAPHQQVQTIQIWDHVDTMRLKISRVPEHLIPRDRPVFRPSELSMVLARSYVRYLCRTHGAASAELIRHTREPFLPAVLFLGEPMPGSSAELLATFGEITP